MALGRHQKAVEVQTLALEEARAAQAQCEQLVGELLADRLDATEAFAQLQAAESRVKQLELAVSVARQRLEVAEVTVKSREQQAKREQLRERLTQLHEVAREHQDAMDAAARCDAKLARRMNAVLELGHDPITRKITNARLRYKACLLATSPSMPGCRVPENGLLKHEPWIESLPKPSDADTVTWP